jgi:hypothetical protein
VGRGDDEEAVVVTAVTPTDFTATFTRSHPKGSPITARGNPGPWSRYNPAADADVVPFFSVID